MTRKRFVFLSTLPARGATDLFAKISLDTSISIHAPREGSDGWLRPPRIWPRIFLSTLPARGATTPM